MAYGQVNYMVKWLLWEKSFHLTIVMIFIHVIHSDTYFDQNVKITFIRNYTLFMYVSMSMTPRLIIITAIAASSKDATLAKALEPPSPINR